MNYLTASNLFAMLVFFCCVYARHKYLVLPQFLCCVFWGTKQNWRLQGFSEKQADNIMTVNSDNQVYKQAGNSVTVNVIQAIGTRIKKLNDELEEPDNES